MINLWARSFCPENFTVMSLKTLIKKVMNVSFHEERPTSVPSVFQTTILQRIPQGYQLDEISKAS